VRANQRALGVCARPRALLASYARYHTETAAIGAGRLPEMATQVELAGWQHIEEARQAGRGIIFLTAHVGNWDLLASVLSLRCGGGIVWVERLRPQALFDHYSALRRRGGLEVVTGSLGVRTALRALRGGRCVGFVADRPIDGVSESVEVTGVRIDLPMGPYRLAEMAGARLIPVVLFRRGDGYVLEVSPPLVRDAAKRERDREVAMATEFAEHVRRWVRKAPDQWLLFSPVAVDA
jgi:KDO2-lipid IV(A) lauroyltransferase